jgi:hypothetical protein
LRSRHAESTRCLGDADDDNGCHARVDPFLSGASSAALAQAISLTELAPARAPPTPPIQRFAPAAPAAGHAGIEADHDQG